MEKTAAVRTDPKKPIVVNDETYALIKVLEELTKAIETLAAETVRRGR
jgi:hypothetical protein